MILAAVGILYGLTHLGSMELKIIHERSPLFVQMSDGTIQNKYDVKILNKQDKTIEVKIDVEGPEGLEVMHAEEALEIESGKLLPHFVYLRVPREELEKSRTPVTFKVYNVEDPKDSVSYESAFFGPRM